MTVNTAKTDRKLHLLWTSNPTVILHQVGVVLVIAQLLQAPRPLGSWF